ncbi:hypothetical protein MKZ38_009248 [Zalerion maritima]|uniref:Uncharacterized protein n=1 Tax=Zalerion maritima TaxID=339359 RepID=A0AAD5WVU1_9PEZI|nr:hypothetical protein MKZ38_009248 [Zalerion maritima]
MPGSPPHRRHLRGVGSHNQLLPFHIRQEFDHQRDVDQQYPYQRPQFDNANNDNHDGIYRQSSFPLQSPYTLSQPSTFGSITSPTHPLTAPAREQKQQQQQQQTATSRSRSSSASVSPLPTPPPGTRGNESQSTLIPSYTFPFAQSSTHTPVYTPDNTFSPPPHHHRHPSRQPTRLKLFLAHLTRPLLHFALTLLLIGGFFLVITFYQGFVLDPTRKSTFDALIVGLSIALGLNVAAALKGGVKGLVGAWVLRDAFEDRGNLNEGEVNEAEKRQHVGERDGYEYMAAGDGKGRRFSGGRKLELELEREKERQVEREGGFLGTATLASHEKHLSGRPRRHIWRRRRKGQEHPNTRYRGKKHNRSLDISALAHIDSLSELMKVAYKSPLSKIGLVFALWLLLGLLMQAGIAVISLTYETDPGIADIYLGGAGKGKVSVANMSLIDFDTPSVFQGALTDSLAAHVLGSSSAGFNVSELPGRPLIDEAFASNPADIWTVNKTAATTTTDGGGDGEGEEFEYQYHFLRSAAPSQDRGETEEASSNTNTITTSGTNFVSVYTNKFAKASAVCRTPKVSILSASPSTGNPVFSSDGTTENPTNLVAALVEDTVNGTLANRTTAFPILAAGSEAIYYITQPYSSAYGGVTPDPGVSDGGGETGQCGPGCSTVEVFEPYAGAPADGSSNPDNGVNNGFYYYVCNITVSMATLEPSPEEENVLVEKQIRDGDDDGSDEAARQEPYIPSLNRAVFAQSIALSGQIASEYYLTNLTNLSPGAADDPSLLSVTSSTQFVSYNLGLAFGERMNNSAPGMARQVSRFAIGAAAAAAQRGSNRAVVGGSAPKQGVRLVVKSGAWFVGLLLAVAGVQIGVGVGVAWVGSLRGVGKRGLPGTGRGGDGGEDGNGERGYGEGRGTRSGEGLTRDIDQSWETGYGR